MSLPSDGAARELIQELHGLIKDGRQLSRELQAGRAQLRSDIESVASGVADAYTQALDRLLSKHVAEITETIDAANNGITERAAVLAGTTTADEFISTVVHGLLPDVIAALREGLDRAASAAAADFRRQAGPPPKRGKKPLPPAAVIVVQHGSSRHG